MDNIKEQSVKFSVDAQLVGELGERLVTNHYIALGELIKNAYDADSPSVTISLVNVTKASRVEPKERVIVVSDSGSGMTLKQIQSYWMKIATTHKSESPLSHRYGRSSTGNKGIGRFACQRLAERLILESTAVLPNGRFQTTHVEFEWARFKGGRDVTEIPCDYSVKTSKTGQTGVTLKLVGVRDLWTERDFNMLQKNVSLISVAKATKREGYDEDPGFEIDIDAEEFVKEKIELGSKFLESGWGTLTGEVQANGKLVLKLKHKGRSKAARSEFPVAAELEGVTFTVFIVPGPSRYKEVENRRNTTLLTHKVRSDIREFMGGIRLYLNSFRVYPYGDIKAGDDWLKIAADVSKRRSGNVDPALKGVAESLGLNGREASRAMLNHPSAESLIGEIHIGPGAAKHFEPKMDREGLVETKSFRDLCNTIRLSLDWVTFHYEAFIREELKRARDESVEVFENAYEMANVGTASTQDLVKQAFEVIKSNAPKKEASDEGSAGRKDGEGKQRKEEPESFSAASSFLEKHVSVLEAEVTTLRAVASTAPLMFVFSHEFKGITGTLLSHAAHLDQLSSRLDTEGSVVVKGLASEARSSVDQYEKILDLFDVFSDSQNFNKSNIHLKAALTKVLAGFEYLFSSFDIEVDTLDVSPIVRLSKLNEAEVYSVLINAISNSVKAMIVKKGMRKLGFSFTQENGKLTMNIMDTGIGLAKKHWVEVFDPFRLDPEGKIYSGLSSAFGENQQLVTLGKGSGLGLHILRSIVEKYKGRAEFVAPPEGWKTCLRLEFPR